MTAPPTARKVAVGLIGAGSWARRAYLPAFAGHPSAEMVGVCSRTEATVAQVAREFAVPNAFTDWRALLDLNPLDAVIICTPTREHYPIAMAALERGLHVLCEKPLGMDLPEAQRMHTSAVRAGVRHMVAFTTRFVPHAIHARELIADGYVGSIRHVTVTKMAGYADDPQRDNWRYVPAESGGGVLADLGCHAIDAAQWLVGRMVRVSACLSVFVGRPDPAADDAVEAIAEFEGGAVGVLHVSWVAHRGILQRVEVCGSAGTLVLETNPDEWRSSLSGCRRDEGEPRAIEVPGRLLEGIDPSSPEAGWRSFIASYPSMARAFVDAILRDEPASPDFADGARTQAVMDAIRHSSATGEWADVESIGEDEREADSGAAGR